MLSYGLPSPSTLTTIVTDSDEVIVNLTVLYAAVGLAKSTLPHADEFNAFPWTVVIVLKSSEYF